MIYLFKYHKKYLNQSVNCCSGFTLLELIVVLCLASLSLGLVSVYFAGSLTSTKIKSEVRRLSSTVRYAKSYAQLEGKEQNVIVDLDEKKYWIEDQNKVTDLPQKIKMTVITSDYEKFDGKWKITLLSGGGIKTDVDAVILSTEKRQFRINIDPVVGAVVVK